MATHTEEPAQVSLNFSLFSFLACAKMRLFQERRWLQAVVHPKANHVFNIRHRQPGRWTVVDCRSSLRHHALAASQGGDG